MSTNCSLTHSVLIRACGVIRGGRLVKIARVKWLHYYRWTQPSMENENILYGGSYEAGLYREECPLLVGPFYVNEELQIQTV